MHLLRVCLIQFTVLLIGWQRLSSPVRTQLCTGSPHQMRMWRFVLHRPPGAQGRIRCDSWAQALGDRDLLGGPWPTSILCLEFWSIAAKPSVYSSRIPWWLLSVSVPRTSISVWLLFNSGCVDLALKDWICKNVKRLPCGSFAVSTSWKMPSLWQQLWGLQNLTKQTKTAKLTRPQSVVRAKLWRAGQDLVVKKVLQHNLTIHFAGNFTRSEVTLGYNVSIYIMWYCEAFEPFFVPWVNLAGASRTWRPGT